MPESDLANNLDILLNLVDDDDGPKTGDEFAEEWVNSYIGVDRYSPYAINAKAGNAAILGDKNDAQSAMLSSFKEMMSLGERGIGSPSIAAEAFGDVFRSFYETVTWIPLPPYFLAILDPSAVPIAQIELIDKLGSSFSSPGQTTRAAADSMANIFHAFSTSLKLLCTRPSGSPPFIQIDKINLEL